VCVRTPKRWCEGKDYAKNKETNGKLSLPRFQSLRCRSGFIYLISQIWFTSSSNVRSLLVNSCL
jgi:hypothetical protein